MNRTQSVLDAAFPGRDRVVIIHKVYPTVEKAREQIVNTLWEMNRDNRGNKRGEVDLDLIEYLAMAGEFNRRYPHLKIEQRETIPTAENRTDKQPHPLEKFYGATPA